MGIFGSSPNSWGGVSKPFFGSHMGNFIGSGGSPVDQYAANVVFVLDTTGGVLSDRLGLCTTTLIGSGGSVTAGKITLNGAAAIRATHSSLIMSSSAFCYELLVKHSTTNPALQTLVDTRGTDNNSGLSFYFSTSTTLTTYPVNSGFSVTAPNTTEIVHYAVSRDSSGNLTQWVRGTSVGTVSGAEGVWPQSSQVYFGNNGMYNGYFLTGEIYGARVTKGVPRYTANFTPPTSL